MFFGSLNADNTIPIFFFRKLLIQKYLHIHAKTLQWISILLRVVEIKRNKEMKLSAI